jgi:hypothetical protein
MHTAMSRLTVTPFPGLDGSHRRRRRAAATNWLRLAGTVVFGAIGLAGCGQNPGAMSRPADGGPSRKAGTDPSLDEVLRMLEPNVLGVSCFYDPFNPWIWNSEHTRVRGLKINALYLRGPNVTGVFGDGTIQPKMYVGYRDEQGIPQFKLIKEWSFDVQQAMPFRSRRRTRAGWGYSLYLNWGDLNLAGRDIRLTVEFVRNDGIKVPGSRKDFRVPEAGKG